MRLSLPALLPRLGPLLVPDLPSPGVQRPLLALLRERRPVLVVCNTALVTRAADVREVLAGDGAFGVVDTYAARMEGTCGAFILGMDDGPHYQRERSVLRQAVRPEDPERVRALVREHAGALLARARAGRRLDVVQDFGLPLATGLLDRYFGVSGPDPRTLQRWMRALFHELFLNLGGDAAVTQAAHLAALELNAYLVDLVARRQAALAHGSDRDDFLVRLLRMQGTEATRLDDAGVRRNVSGVIVGALDTLSKALAHVVEELLGRPAVLAKASEAARGGDTAALSAYAFEALRFRPHNPLLLRTCLREHVLARGTRHETVLPRGMRVVASTLSAMFDPAAVEHPEAFRVDRAQPGHLHFGAGLHACFGEQVARAFLPEALGALLRPGGLRRARGRAGRLRYAGPFPVGLGVELGGA